MEYNDTPPEGPGLVSSCCGADYEEVMNKIDFIDEETEYICEKCKESFDTNKDNWIHIKGFKCSKKGSYGWNVPNAFICSKCK